MKNPPLVVYSELSRRFYAVTRYSIHGEGLITAQIKYDVTDSFMEAMERYQKDVRSASPEAPAAPTDYCDMCKQPVTGSVHYVLVSGAHRCCQCANKLREAQSRNTIDYESGASEICPKCGGSNCICTGIIMPAKAKRTAPAATKEK